MKHLIKTAAVAALLGALPAHAHDGDHTCANENVAKDIELIKPVAAPTGETQLTPEIEAEIDEAVAEAEALLTEMDAEEAVEAVEETVAETVVETAAAVPEGGGVELIIRQPAEDVATSRFVDFTADEAEAVEAAIEDATPPAEPKSVAEYEAAQVGTVVDAEAAAAAMTLPEEVIIVDVEEVVEVVAPAADNTFADIEAVAEEAAEEAVAEAITEAVIAEEVEEIIEAVEEDVAIEALEAELEAEAEAEIDAEYASAVEPEADAPAVIEDIAEAIVEEAETLAEDAVLDAVSDVTPGE